MAKDKQYKPVEPSEDAPTPPKSAMQQVVEGGNVRRIVFADSSSPAPAPAAPPAATPVAEPTVTTRVVRRYEPRALPSASLSQIHHDVDNLGYRKAGPKALQATRISWSDVYRTEKGSVRRWTKGSSSVISTTHHDGLRELDEPFLHSKVDKVIAGVTLREETVIKETVTEKVLKSEAPKDAKEGKASIAVSATVTSSSKDAWEPDGYQDQCVAITADGVQCRNSSRQGSKYCGSHRNYRTPGAKAVVANRDTTPRHKVAKDTVPHGKTKSQEGEHQVQCTALTAAGSQCRNSSRKNSKYCAAHKGYRPPSAAQLASRLRTKPRHTKAKDTKPRVKK